MALATGFSVANCYYNQSLLGSIVSDFHASEYDGSIISALTQFGYVVGLCIVIPLGNTLSKKRIITIDYFLLFYGSSISRYNERLVYHKIIIFHNRDQFCNASIFYTDGGSLFRA